MELIKLSSDLPINEQTINNRKVNAINARDLHEFMEVKSRFNDWITKRIKDYDFVENQDFITFTENLVNGGKMREYYISLDMAKELSMVERNDKGREARKYFIECERKLTEQHQLPQTFAEALKLAYEQQLLIETQKEQIGIMQPKAEYFDGLVSRNLLTNLRDTAKELGIKQKEFISYLLSNGYLYRDNQNKLRPYAQHTPALFELKEHSNDRYQGVQTLVTPRGRETFRLLLN